MLAMKRWNETARGFIGKWTRCTRLRGQILWLPISPLPWRSLAKVPSNSTSTCGYWTICALPAIWWLGQKWPCSPQKRPPTRNSASTPVRKQSPNAKNVCNRPGGLTQPVSEIRAKGLDPGCHSPNCRRRGSSNRKAGTWKNPWPVAFPSWIWP